MALFLKRVKQRPGPLDTQLSVSLSGVGVRVPDGLPRRKSGLKKKIWPERRATPTDIQVILMIKGLKWQSSALEGFSVVLVFFLN